MDDLLSINSIRCASCLSQKSDTHCLKIWPIDTDSVLQRSFSFLCSSSLSSKVTLFIISLRWNECDCPALTSFKYRPIFLSLIRNGYCFTKLILRGDQCEGLLCSPPKSFGLDFWATIPIPPHPKQQICLYSYLPLSNVWLGSSPKQVKYLLENRPWCLKP